MKKKTNDLVGVSIAAATCQNVSAALEREWLVTNGIGGYAFGTIAGALTRRYHGLLIAALKPPLGRTMLLSKIDDTVEVNGKRIPLYTNVWRTGVESPNGCAVLESFELIAGVATWRYVIEGATLLKRIWMEQGENTTYVQYVLEKAASPLALSLRLLVTNRDHHHTSPNDDRRFEIAQTNDGLTVRAAQEPASVAIRISGDAAASASWTPDHAWYRDFQLPFEESVGYEHLDAHLCAGICRARMKQKQTLTLTCASLATTSAATPRTASDGLTRRVEWSGERLQTFRQANPGLRQPVPAAIDQLVLAADQFIVARPTPELPDGHTIIAGYPWFTDWGRDTMISLPGLTLSTGRREIAREILRTWARYVDQGMIPNRFPDAGDTPEYNTVDATLWYLWAIDLYVRATDDIDTLRELFPVMCEIVDWHQSGTRYRIHVADDGLIYAGEPGVQLTWMDAKVGERVITPRIGKPIEINALWYDALNNLTKLSERLSNTDRAREFAAMATRVRGGFSKFWNGERSCCFDLIDGPNGSDARIQANQIFAVSLTHSPLTPEQQRAVVQTVGQTLLTPVGLRTLDPAEPLYHPRYCGRIEQRDEAYHQGTAWGWLLGPFALAHFRVHNDSAAAERILSPVFEQLSLHGLGAIAEIFDADAPHHPRGCVAQAWSVAETLRAWCETQRTR